MKEEIEKAIDKMIADGWITINEHLVKGAVVDLIAAHTLAISYQAYKEWYLK